MNKKWMRLLSGAFSMGFCLALTASAEEEKGAAVDTKAKPAESKTVVVPGGVIYSPSPYSCPKPGATYILPSTPSIPSTDPTTPRPPDGQQPAAPDAQAPVDAAPADAAEAAGEAASDVAMASGTMLGRGDANNRFNQFDNFNAIPTNRVWFGYMYLDSFDTNIDSASGFNSKDFVPRRQQGLYRMGAEVKLRDWLSVSFQHQYIAGYGTPNSADAWGSPQITAKAAIYRTDCTCISAIVGYQPEVSVSDNELHESDSRIYPGLLFFRKMNNLFVQGGFQFNLSTRDAPNSFDAAVSLGYWLYRRDDCGRPRCDGMLRGIIPMVEIFDKSVIANSRRNPFEINTGGADVTTGAAAPALLLLNQPAPYFENRNVIDVTVGARILLGGGLSIGTGVSYPLTGPEVRSTEFLTTLNYNF